jgi:hypothetical protein
MTQFTYMAIKVADEQEFNQVAEKLRGMGYRADADPEYGSWQEYITQHDPHVLTHEGGKFGLYNHDGNGNPARYTYEQFMKL